MTGNPILNQKFNQDPFLDEFTGELTEPVKVNEASVMVSGLVQISIEFNGIPIYVNKDLNSPFAFRPLLYDMQVKCFDLHVSIHLKIALCNTSAFFHWKNRVKNNSKRRIPIQFLNNFKGIISRKLSYRNKSKKIIFKGLIPS